MSKELAGKVQTVLGPVSPEDLGITLMHEHCVIDIAVWFNEPKEATQKGLAYQKVKLENLGWIRFHMNSNLDNLRLLNEQEIIEELELFKRAGGNTLVDCTVDDIGRDPSALARISRAVGINIIMGSGYYKGVFYGSKFVDRSKQGSEQELAKEIIRDIKVSVRDTGVKAGIIGEIGCSWPLLDTEKKVLRAVAIAQQETGAPITIHPGRHEEAPMEIIKILDKAGADITRTIIGHIERTIYCFENLLELAKTGCYLEFDRFGVEFDDLALKTEEYLNDERRIGIILKLADKGFLEQVLISRDTCQKIDLVCYGGAGYGHILNNVIPRMLGRGLSREGIDTILVKNPKRILTFV